MTARDDYPLDFPPPWQAVVDVHAAMCDEIDRLRRRLDLSQGIGIRDIEMPDAEDAP